MDFVIIWVMYVNWFEDEELVVLGDLMMWCDGYMKKVILEEFWIYVDSLFDLFNYLGFDRLCVVRGVLKMCRVFRLMWENIDFFQEMRS